MTIAEIIELVKDVTGVQVDELGRRVQTYPTYARYVAMMLMIEEGYDLSAIAASLNMHRSSPCKALPVIDDKLQSDQLIKKIYMACGERMADLEEQAI
ncbi:hypothetical protein AB6735_18560 [Mucilaginibacter sp. RCC_168]|uniref:hypothetical protein n=1 Tax=Mucilaginibacter sp. RCC_168 TaxID=3239221 RepID=UPI003526C33E